MKRISRYIIRASFAPFIFGTATVIFLFLMQFLMKNIDKLVGKGIDDIVIVQLIAYNIAWMVILAVPMGVLFASLVAFGNMSANHEITILKASGGSLISMMFPMFAASSILAYALFLYNSEIIPETNHLAKTLLYDVQRKKPTFAIEPGQFCNEIEGYTILARQVDTTNNTLYFTTIYDFKTPNISRTINAERCNIGFSKDMSKLEFVLINGEMHQSNNGRVNNYRYSKFKEYRISTTASGFTFEQSDDGSIGRGDREMFIEDMQQIIDTANSKIAETILRQEYLLNNHIAYLFGEPNLTYDTSNILTLERNNYLVERRIGTSIAYNSYSSKVVSEFIFSLQNCNNTILSCKERANGYEVEIHKKYSIPFACIVFILIGCPLGIITKGGNFGLSAAITLFFYIVYWAGLITGEKLADRAIIAPVISMWLGNIVIGIVGVILTLKANNESLTVNPFKKIILKFRRT